MAADLKPHEQRVLIEFRELSEDLDKLKVFLRSDLAVGLDQDDLALLVAQAGAMTSYQQILAMRIKRWTGESPMRLSSVATTRFA